MEIINYSVDWARGEVFSAKVIALISVFVLLCAAGFYFWGKTSMARAYWMPLAVSGVILSFVAGALFFTNHPRIERFQQQYSENPEAFVQSELERTAKSDRDLNLVVYTVLPAIIILCGIAVMLVGKSTVRAWLITLMMLGAFLMAVDSNTKARNYDYRQHLLHLHE